MNFPSLEMLQNPAYLHLLFHPIPIYGLATGTVALAITLLTRHRQSQLLALWLISLTSICAVPAYLTGQRAYNDVYLLADGDGQTWLDLHMKRAERGIYLLCGLAIVAACAAVLPVKSPRAAVPLAVLTLLLALAGLALSGHIAYAGGKVRHPEFREPVENKSVQKRGSRFGASPI